MVIEVEFQQMPAYQAFLNALPSTPITQSTRWPRVKARKGWQEVRFAALHDDAGETGAPQAELQAPHIAAVGQMLFVKDTDTGRYFCYLPRGPVTAGDPTQQAAAIREVVAAAYEYARSLDASCLLVDPPWEYSPENQALLQELAQAHPNGRVVTSPTAVRGQPPLNMILDLAAYADYDAWMAALNKKHRYSIRRAETDGARGRFSRDRSLVEPLYDLITKVAACKKITHRPKQYFYDLFDAFDGAFFTVGLIEDQLTSVSLNVAYGDTIYNLYAGNDISLPKSGTPTLMNAAIVEEAFNRQVRYVDFGGVFAPDSSDSLYVFKRHFMPKDQTVTRYVGEVIYEID